MFSYDSIIPKHCAESALPICRALLNAPMREGQEGDVDIQDVRKPVFQALLFFTYTDQLPEVQFSPLDAGLHCMSQTSHLANLLKRVCHGSDMHCWQKCKVAQEKDDYCDSLILSKQLFVQ